MDKEERLPTAGTCFNKLNVFRHTNNFDKFNEDMNTAIHATGFGLA